MLRESRGYSWRLVSSVSNSIERALHIWRGSLSIGPERGSFRDTDVTGDCRRAGVKRGKDHNVKNLFDLQRFAAEAETAENAEAENTEAIPAELAGVSEDIAREAMQAAKAQAEPAEPGDPAEAIPAELAGGSADAEAAEPVENAEDGNPVEAAEADSENKQYAPSQKIPYVRFKQELDKKKELEAQVKALSAQMEALKAQPQQPAPPPMQPAQAGMQQPRITPEATRQLNAIVRQQALQLTGFSKEDVDALSYMDDDDPRREQWKTALDVARTQVIDGVYKMQQQRAAYAKHFMQVHNAAVADYNAFAAKEMSEPDYPQVMQYAINEYFTNGISNAEQPAIAAAYQRIERNLASPGDIALVKRYFSDAKAAWKAANEAAASKAEPMKKAAQAQQFPRAGKVQGAADTGGNISAATLDKMLAEKNWEDIPDKYKRMLLSGELGS